MAVEIRLLGNLEVVRNRRVLTLPASKKTRALLGYLIATNRPHSRAHLCDMFWEGPDDPRAALRWSLSKIRAVLDEQDPPLISADHDQAAFATSAARVDLLTVRAATGGDVATASTEVLKQSTELLRGELLDGLDLPDCYRYHEWWIAERESIRAFRISVLSTLVDRLRVEPDIALSYARARLVIDPFSEEAHIQIIQLLGSSGHIREAIQQYESCRRMLQGQLGAKPSAALEGVRSALGSARSTVPATAAEMFAPVTVIPQQPLIGRDSERRYITEAVTAACNAHPHPILWITGEPGVGKTRLLEEISAQVQSIKCSVLKGKAYEAEMVRPYGPWIDALRSTEIKLTDPSLSDRNHLFDAVANLIADLSKAAMLALILDDLQWFDEASVALLHFIARALPGSRLLIACAARSVEMTDNPAADGLFRQLRRERRLHHLQIERLDAASIHELVKGIDTKVDAARVFTESEGNPLFAIEIAQALALGEELPFDTIEGLIVDRLGKIGERGRDVLPWAAALGRNFNPEILRAVSGLAPAEIVAVMKELEDRGVVRTSISSANDYDFSHDLIRRAAYSQISAPRRRIVHLQLARALTGVPDPEATFASEVAHHASLGGDSELAARASVAAGQRSLRMFAYVEAYALANRALQGIRVLALPLRSQLRLELLKIAVHASIAVAGGRNLDSEISQAIVEAQQTGLAAEVAAGFHLLSFLHHHDGNYVAAHDETLRAAEAGRTADPITAARALASTGRCLALIERDMSRAESMLVEAETLAAQAGIALVDVVWGLGLVRAFAGDYDKAVDLLKQGLALAGREDDHWAICECLQRLALIELERGNSDRTRECAKELAAVASKIGEGSEAPFAVTLEALSSLMLGDPKASARFDEAIAVLRQIDAKALLSRALAFAAIFDLEARNLRRAAGRAKEALAAAEVVGRRSEIVKARAILARVAQASGDRCGAIEQKQHIAGYLLEPESIAAHARRAANAISST